MVVIGRSRLSCTPYRCRFHVSSRCMSTVKNRFSLHYALLLATISLNRNPSSTYGVYLRNLINKYNDNNRILRDAWLHKPFNTTFSLPQMSTNGHSYCLLLRSILFCAELCQTQASARFVSTIETATSVAVV